MRDENSGIYQREQQRKESAAQRQKEARAFANELVDAEVINLLTANPAHFDDETVRTHVVETLKVKLHERFAGGDRFCVARAQLARRLDALNKECGAKFDVPSVPAQARVPKSSRSETFFQDQRKLHEFHKRLMDRLFVSHPREDYTRLECLYLALYFAATFGKLSTGPELEALYQYLRSGERYAYSPSRELCWLDLTYESKKSHNVKTSDGSNKMRRWFPDALTLCFLVRYTRLNRSATPDDVPLEREFEVQPFFRTLTDIADEPFPFKGLNSFANAGISIIENLSSTPLSQLLVDYAIGRTEASSLPEPYWSLYLGSGPLKNRTLKSLPSVSTQTIHASKIEPIGELAEYEHQISDALKPLASQTTLHRSKLRQRLLGIEASQPPTLVKHLIGWYLYELLGRRGLASSTVRRYHQWVCAGWLVEFDGLDLSTLTADDYAERYQYWIDHSKTSERNKIAGRLDDFHAYLASKKLAPPLGIRLSVSHKGVRFVRARVVPEWLFREAVSHLQDSDLDAHQQACFSWMMTLCFRCGLRISEVCRLRLKDIEDYATPWIQIRNTKLGRIKNGQAHRLPLFAMLTTKELDAFIAWIGPRHRDNRKKNQLVFAPIGAPSTLWHPHELRNLVTRLLSEIAGTTFSPHDLRHSTATRLMAILETGTTVDDCPYTEPELVRLRDTLFTKHPDARDRYWHLAAVMNHAGPSETFLSYVHVCDLLLHEATREARIPIPSDVAATLVGTRIDGVSKLPSYTKFGKLDIQEATPLIWKSASRCFVKSDGGQSQRIRKKEKVRAYNHVLQHRSVAYKDPVAEACDIISDLEDGRTIEAIAYHYKKDFQWVSNFRDAVDRYSTKTTQSGKARHHSKARLQSEKTALGPSLLHERADQELARKLVGKLRRLYAKDKALVEFAITYWEDHTNSSGSEIRFYNPKDLKRFLKCFRKADAFSEERWLVRVTPTTEKSEEKLRPHWQVRKNLTLERSRQAPIKSAAELPFGNVHLHLRAETSITRKGATKNSSKALRFVMSMLWILTEASASG